MVHRRDEFRGNADTIKNKKVFYYLSYVPDTIKDGIIDIKSVKDGSIYSLNYDYILVSYGSIAQKQKFEPSDSVYFIGDCLEQTRTIAYCMETVDKVMYNILSK